MLQLDVALTWSEVRNVPQQPTLGCLLEWSRRTGLARGLASDHRENRAGEISSGFHQLICASRFKFVSGAITPQHAKTAHSDSMSPGNIMPAVPNHQAPGRRDIMLRQNMGEQFRFVIQLATRY